MLLVQELAEPVEVEPPDGVGHELAEGKGPGLTVADELEPGNGGDRLRRIAADVVELRLRKPRMRLGRPIEHPPDPEPEEADRPRHDERPLPAPGEGDEGNDRGRDHRADVGPGVEDAGGERPLFLREPLRHRLDGGREVGGLAEAQGEAGDPEAQGRARRGVEHGGDAPEGDREGEAEAGAHPVEQAARHQQPEGVGGLEGGHDIAVLDLAPADAALEVGGEDPQHLPVDVVDGGGEEEQGADRPAEVAGPGRGGDGYPLHAAPPGNSYSSREARFISMLYPGAVGAA